MVNIKLNHLRALDVARSNVLNGVESFDDFEKNIIAWANDNPSQDPNSDDTYECRFGACGEVFNQFFGKKYFKASAPHLNLVGIVDTSKDRFNVGFDFTSKTIAGLPVYIQTKFRANHYHQFTNDEISTLLTSTMQCAKEQRILFTNVIDNKKKNSSGLLHYSIQHFRNSITIFDRNEIESWILRDPNFWNDFRKSLKSSTQKPKYGVAPRMRTHQKEMSDAIQPILNAGVGRGRIICATGGGKTRVEYETIHHGFFKQDFKLEVLVAPTINLLSQHHETFTQYNLFHKDKVAIIHFRTGSDVSSDSFIDYRQTTSVDELKKILSEFSGRKVLILVTYASEEKLFDGLRELEKQADVVIWDEFHHAVKQSEDFKQHMLMIPSNINLFFSASEKLGWLLSSTDETIFGKRLCDIPYSRMRKDGVLVPRVIIKPVRINENSRLCLGLKSDMEKLANQDGFDLKTCIIEAGACVVAHKDMQKTHLNVNMLTFSKGVPLCKEIASSPAVAALLPDAIINAVYGELPSQQRTEIFAKIKTSSNSLLCQHSVVKEGIDLTSFNSLIMSRNMEKIGTQQALGRIVRADPEDTRRLQNGEISLDDPTGWKKYSATVYVIITDDEMNDYRKSLKELIDKLQGSGLTEEDYQFVDMVESRHSAELEEGDWICPLPGDIELDVHSLNAIIKALEVEIEEEEKIEKEQHELEKLIEVSKKKTLFDLL